MLVNAAAGGVGTALVQLSKLKGCEVFGTAGSDDKMPYLRKIGVDHAINYRTSDFGAEIRLILNGRTLDVAFDSLGGKTYKTSNSLLGSGGRMVSFGVAEVSGWKGGIHGPGLWGSGSRDRLFDFRIRRRSLAGGPCDVLHCQSGGRIVRLWLRVPLKIRAEMICIFATCFCAVPAKSLARHPGLGSCEVL